MKPTLPKHKVRDKRITLRFSDEELAVIYDLLDIDQDTNISTKIREYVLEQAKLNCNDKI